MISTAAGTTQGSAIWQTISPALTQCATYTLSFWYLQSTNGGPLTLRLSRFGHCRHGESEFAVAAALATGNAGRREQRGRVA